MCGSDVLCKLRIGKTGTTGSADAEADKVAVLDGIRQE